MRNLSIATALVCLAFLNPVGAQEKLSMSEADKQMYLELLENNPAEMDVAEGEQLFEQLIALEDYAKMLGTTEDKLPNFIAGFPRYIDSAGRVVTIAQTIQMAASLMKKPVANLESNEMIKMSAYVKSLANDEVTNIDVNANEHMKRMYALGDEVFHERRGGRGLSCNNCHSSDIVGSRLRMQELPDLGAPATAAAGTWPAYRMTQSKLITLDKRMQQCMNNALLATIPLGSEEMVALEVYVTNKTKGNTISVPSVKR